jgi:hypothetical protein
MTTIALGTYWRETLWCQEAPTLNAERAGMGLSVQVATVRNEAASIPRPRQGDGRHIRREHYTHSMADYHTTTLAIDNLSISQRS